MLVKREPVGLLFLAKTADMIWPVGVGRDPMDWGQGRGDIVVCA